ncbi:DNA-binding protein [Thermococcus litoralis DSM 5473]|uniref:DNA-binding protein n=1 Tax=Thermococcus litoralis (strain ATCC 51850 / DSM 5473 / JCM 8560 / NS-C) TaxID=523849 RepID=H3ZL18_THELN|nr:HEPN domain-containing protein [Thermococcus litoralis]EHR79357.1 DNA-binding protein [Thermococcus litoralis DSM 5473]
MHYEEVEVLLQMSEDYMELANSAFEGKKYDAAIFLAEQALQFYLKALLIKYADVRLRTHSVRELLAALGKALESEEKVADFIRSHRSLLRELEDAYIGTRYEPRRYYREDAEELMEFVGEVMDFVEGLANEFERKNP